MSETPEARSAASARVKLPCGCYVEWSGDAWRIAATAFTCDHKQGDHVDGAAARDRVGDEAEGVSVANHGVAAVTYPGRGASPSASSSAARNRDTLLRNYVATRVGQIPVAV